MKEESKTEYPVNTNNRVFFQNQEEEKRTAKLLIGLSNQALQHRKKEKRVAELIHIDIELDTYVLGHNTSVVKPGRFRTPEKGSGNGFLLACITNPFNKPRWIN